MAASFVIVKIPPGDDSTDLLAHLVKTKYQFTVVRKPEDAARFVAQETTGTSTSSQLSLTTEAAASASTSSSISQGHDDHHPPPENLPEPLREEEKEEIQPPVPSPPIDQQQGAEDPDPESINVLELLTEDDIKTEEITDDDYIVDKVHQQSTEPQLVKSEKGITGKATAYKNDVEMSSVEPPSSQPLSVVKSEFQTDPPSDLSSISSVGSTMTIVAPVSDSTTTRKKYFVKSSSAENEGKFYCSAKTVTVKRKDGGKEKTLDLVHTVNTRLATSPISPSPIPKIWEPLKNASLPRAYIRNSCASSYKVVRSSANSQVLYKLKDDVTDFRGSGESVGSGNLFLPRGTVRSVLAKSESQASVPSTSSASSSRTSPVDNNPLPIRRLADHLREGPFFAFNLTAPLKVEFVPLLLASFSQPRSEYPIPPCRQGSLFFFATIRMVDQPWLYLCPKAITSGFQVQRFVFLRKTNSDYELIPALFQYIMETVDAFSTANNQVLRCRTVEVGMLATAVNSFQSITRNAGVKTSLDLKTPSPSAPKLEKSAPFPPLKLSLTSSTPIFESDIFLYSIVSAIDSRGFFFASSFLTPLALRVIPAILKKKNIQLSNQMPLDFTKSGSFFRVLRRDRAFRDAYAPWFRTEMICRHSGDTKVTRYSCAHPCTGGFTRYIFTIESTEIALYQYVVDGPMPPIAWKGGRRAQKEYTGRQKTPDDIVEEPKSPEEIALSAPRSTSTRFVKVTPEK